MTVTSYQVGTNHSRDNAGAHRRFLSLSGTGDRNSAIIYFWPGTPGSSYFTANLVVGLLPVADFDDWYNVLRSERPVLLTWVEAPNSQIYHIGIGTTNEAVGEGPADRSS